MVLFSQLPYSGMGVFRKVTGDSFSRGWGIKPPARFFQSPKRYRTIDWTYFLRVKPVSGTTGSSRTRTLIPLWSPTLKSFSWRWGVIPEDLAHPSTCIEGRSRALLVCREVSFSLASRILLPRVQRLVSGETNILGAARIRSAKIHIICMYPQIWKFSGEIWSGPSWIAGQWLCPRHPHPGPQIVHSRACVNFQKYNLFIQILASVMVLVLVYLALNPLLPWHEVLQTRSRRE